MKKSMVFVALWAVVVLGMAMSQQVRAEDAQTAKIAGKWEGKDVAGAVTLMELNAGGTTMIYEAGKPILPAGSTATWKINSTVTPWQIDISFVSGDKTVVLMMIAELQADGKLKIEGGGEPTARPKEFTKEAILFTKK